MSGRHGRPVGRTWSGGGGGAWTRRLGGRGHAVNRLGGGGGGGGWGGGGGRRGLGGTALGGRTITREGGGRCTTTASTVGRSARRLGGALAGSPAAPEAAGGRRPAGWPGRGGAADGTACTGLADPSRGCGTGGWVRRGGRSTDSTSSSLVVSIAARDVAASDATASPMTSEALRRVDKRADPPRRWWTGGGHAVAGKYDRMPPGSSIGSAPADLEREGGQRRTRAARAATLTRSPTAMLASTRPLGGAGTAGRPPPPAGRGRASAARVPGREAAPSASSSSGTSSSIGIMSVPAYRGDRRPRGVRVARPAWFCKPVLPVRPRPRSRRGRRHLPRPPRQPAPPRAARRGARPGRRVRRRRARLPGGGG